MNEQTTTKSEPSSVATTVCWCGCGGSTKSRFVPGHDARYHGWAKKVLRGELKLDETLAKLPHQASRDHFVAYMELQRPLEVAKAAAKAKVAADKVAAKAKAVADKVAAITPPVVAPPAEQPKVEVEQPVVEAVTADETALVA